jgi:SAM-dependent methyltransferase
MGLTKSALRFIAREHVRKPLCGPVLTLGRQGVLASPREAEQLLRSEGIEPVRPTHPVRSNIPSWASTRRAGNVSDTAFFAMLGLPGAKALDYSEYEGAELVHDLNQPLPPQLHGRFGLIIDGGTIEHVFDVRQSLTNIALLLKPGGRVIHISPANNYVNHGFYQFSPTLFFDYYAANQFADLRCFVAEQDTHWYDVRPWEYIEITPTAGRLTTTRSLMVLFIAEKTEASSTNGVPIQSFYQQTYWPDHQPGVQTIPSKLLRRLLPERVKTLLAWALPFLDPLRKPWGMRRIGRW